MIGKKWGVCIGLAVFAAGCASSPQGVTADGRWLHGAYEGTVPCADCVGIDTLVFLFSPGEFDFTDNQFVLHETYLGVEGGDKTITTEGAWYLLRGDADDPDASVYELDLGDGEAKYFRVEKNGNALRMLDREQREIQSDSNYVLKRVPKTRTARE